MLHILKDIRCSKKYRNLFFVVLFIAVGSAIFTPALAQNQGGDDDKSASNLEAGFHLGTFLPSQVSGLTEVTGMGGVRGGYRLNPTTVAEMSFTMGNGDGASYKNLSLDARFDVPIESFVTFVFIGLDATYYKGVGQNSLLVGGGNLGGGLMSQVGTSLWLRSDMKFSLNPGASLYFSVSLMFRI